jgi:hypothetical protein
MNPTDSPTGTTRRQIITTGAFGAAAAAFLAACGTKSDRKAGQSGDDPTTTAVAPEAPLPEVTDADLAYDQDLLRTATSMELLAADLYEKYGPKVDDAEWKANLARFATDHAAAAKTFQDESKPDARVDEPNEWLITNSVEPVEDQLNDGSDAVILDFFALLESTFAATYITAVSSFSQVEGRAQFAGFAEAAARRNALMGNGGKGNPPRFALYPLQDLIPNEAYVTETQADAGVAADTEDESQS